MRGNIKFDKSLVFRVRGVRISLAAATLFGALAALLIIAQAFCLSTVISGVFLGGRTLRQVWGTLLVLLGVIVVRGMLAWGSEVTANRAGTRARTGVRERLVAHLFALGPAYIRGERSGELVSVLCEGVEALDPYVSQYLPQVVLAVLVPAILLATIFWIDVPSGVILLIVTPILPFIMAVVGMMAGAETRRQWRALSLMSAHFLDVLQGLTTLKIFGGSRRQVEAVRSTSERFRRATMRMLRVAFFSSLVLELGATISTAVIAVEIGLRLLDGLMPFQQALFVLLLAPEYFLPLRLLGARYHAGMPGKVAGQRIADILNTSIAVSQSAAQPSQPQFIVTESTSRMPTANEQCSGSVCSTPTDRVLPEVRRAERKTFGSDRWQGSIRFERVSYTYDGQRPALREVSFDIQPGQKVALVGPSGAGKSTVVHLLLRFIEADRGVVLVDGTPLEKIPVQQWRQHIAWVPEHPYLFHATVAENIRLGREHAPLSAVIEAARLAHAHEFIQALPQGYDTVIGEQGLFLSGGEAQRISLARAFLKNASLLILDEATSYLDAENQAGVLEAIGRLEQGRTVLIIAHRLSTVYDADQIVVVDRGRVVAQGTHDALLRQSSIYRQLVSAYKGGKV
ncbi:MAG: thiol reductant ABC exporter subunit CydD [Ktedonobacteraceae bacterium]